MTESFSSRTSSAKRAHKKTTLGDVVGRVYFNSVLVLTSYHINDILIIISIIIFM